MIWSGALSQPHIVLSHQSSVPGEEGADGDQQKTDEDEEKEDASDDLHRLSGSGEFDLSEVFLPEFLA